MAKKKTLPDKMMIFTSTIIPAPDSPDQSPRLVLTGVRAAPDGSIEDAERAEIPLKNLDAIDERTDERHLAEQRIFAKLFERTIQPIDRASFDRAVDGFLFHMGHIFSMAELERIGRVWQYALGGKDPHVPADAGLRAPDFSAIEWVDKTTEEYFNKHVADRIFLAVTQLALEARALSPSLKLPKAMDRLYAEMVETMRLTRMESHLSDGRGNQQGVEMFDRKAFLADVDAAILKAKRDGASSRDITQKRIADDLGVGDIAKGTGAGVLRKRMQACGVTQSWAQYVDSITESTPKRKRKMNS